MAAVFSTRKLAASFARRNVVITSVAYAGKKGSLELRLAFDFGVHGTLVNYTTVDNISNLREFQRKLTVYQEETLEMIDMLEQIKRWASIGVGGKFCEVLCHRRPILFHAYYKKEALILQIMGEGLYDLVIEVPKNTQTNITPFLNKLEEIANEMRLHLAAVDKLSMEDLLNAVKASQTNNTEEVV